MDSPVSHSPVSRSVQTLLFGVVLTVLGLFGILSVAAAQAQPRGIPDSLTFERATALLLAQNPQLQAARARVQAESRAAQADALYPNPTLGASEEHTPLPGDGADDEWFLSLTQPLNYPGEHRAQQQSADAAQEAAEARLRETRASLYNELRHRYLAVVAADARHRILSRYAVAIRRAAQAATVRYEEGDLSPIHRSRLKSAEATFENDLAEADRQRRTARTELASMILDAPRSASDSGPWVGRYAVSDSLPFRDVAVETEAALSVATEQRAHLHARRAQVERQRHALDATRYQRYPDLSLSAGPKQLSTPSGNTFGFTAGIEVQLPLWNGGHTAVEAQEGRRTQAQTTLEAARRAVEVEVKNALDRLDSYQTRLQTTSGSHVQARDTLLEDALFTYEQGELTLFELLDTIESASQTEVRQVRLTAEYFRALYDLEAAIGRGPQAEPIVVEGALSPLRSAQLP